MRLVSIDGSTGAAYAHVRDYYDCALAHYRIFRVVIIVAMTRIAARAALATGDGGANPSTTLT